MENFKTPIQNRRMWHVCCDHLSIHIRLILNRRTKTALSSFILFSSLFESCSFFSTCVCVSLLLPVLCPLIEKRKNWLSCCFHFNHSIVSNKFFFNIMLHIFLFSCLFYRRILVSVLTKERRTHQNENVQLFCTADSINLFLMYEVDITK